MRIGAQHVRHLNRPPLTVERTERHMALNRDTDKAQKRWTEKQGERDKSLREASLERRRRREEHRV